MRDKLARGVIAASGRLREVAPSGIQLASRRLDHLLLDDADRIIEINLLAPLACVDLPEGQDAHLAIDGVQARDEVVTVELVSTSLGQKQ